MSPLRFDQYPIPIDPRGDWGLAAQLGDHALLTLSPFSRSRAERMTIPGVLARWDPRSGDVTQLHVLRPGMQSAFARGGSDSFAWVELSAIDLRGHDWQLHVTDSRTGVDRIVARDSGIRIAERPGAAVHPTAWFDGTTLLYSLLTNSDSWELHRLRADRDEVIARIPRASLISVTRIVADGDATIWIEREFTSEIASPQGGAIAATLAVRRTESGEIQRRPIPADTYALGLSKEAIYLGTESTVHAQPRDLTLASRVLAEVPQTGWFVELNGRLLCGSVSDQKIIAIDLATSTKTELDQNVTGGPMGQATTGPIMWQRRDVDNRSKVALLSP